ncbi:OLC1v1013663C1 [Oldenlandia corymbosa var. corymbosa]|uniref:OLC1v1013663C1 n=1 Tax=Oldenlandia corymbosa var. corymbosa TaxID=529605 RepID=A0AAV1DYS0_OLDCO|nr:OLC1v1013663C1 [Oldenlandia corymbosa var. corymbosa]
MSSVKVDLSTRIYPEPEEPMDHFDPLPDSLLLLIFNKIGDVKALGRCCVVSKRFHSLVPQVENVVVRVDCVISDDDPSSSSSSSSGSSSAAAANNPAASSSSASAAGDNSRSFLRLFLSSILKPIQSLTQYINSNKRSISSLSHGCGGNDDEDADHNSVTHHSPTQVLRNFNEIKFLRIELPSGELGIDDGVLLKWRADFGSTLDNCVILGASSITNKCKSTPASQSNQDNGSGNPNEGDNGSIPESFYTNGGLKLRVVWTISSLIAASARHYLLQPIIAEHKTLDSLILTDVDGQGVLCMNKEQLEELRVKPLSASSASKRTLVPALNMRLWYAPHLDLPDGTVLKGATLVAIRPSEQPQKEVGADTNWVAASFEEPFGTAARMLVKRRTYCLEMNSF